LRAATAVVGVPLLAVFVWAGLPWLSIVAGAAAALGAWELSRMAGGRGMRPVGAVAALWGAALVAAAHAMATGGSAQLVLTLAVAAALAGVLLGLALMRPRVGLGDWLVTAGAAIYPGVFLAYVPFIRELDQGAQWTYLLLAGVFANDTAAYFVGKAVGRTRMAPGISAGKTWEGAAGGVAGAVGAVAASAYALGLDLAPAWALGLGAMIAVAAQLGDLMESWLKRLCGVKDSGTLVPGHGGLLDRLDSIVFNLALLYYFLSWVIR
jgi:phosphatidate cytidylyltransferase